MRRISYLMPLAHLVQLALLVAGVGSLASSASAQIATCAQVRVTGLAEEQVEALSSSLEGLVRAELDRHGTHASAPEGGQCDTHLEVELLVLEEERVLTGRIDGQVPHRLRVDAEGLTEAVPELLRILLHHDPIVLAGPDEFRGIGGQLRLLSQRGLSLYGIELFEEFFLLDGSCQVLPGVAFVARRELIRWHVGARAAFASRVRDPQRGLSMRARAAASIEAALFLFEDSMVSPYGLVSMGLAYHWIEGPLEGTDFRDDVHQVGAEMSLRVGAELFRHAASRTNVFVQFSLPLFRSHDEDGLVVDAWIPSMAFGVSLLL
ncbi:MAG: hypothetical protein OEY14_06870 [Myxococcales bacterium]|nr:hypothetical protein [Myxococcales bacterium]